MFKSNAEPGPIELDAYLRSQTNIRRLKASLPDDLVASLAREVIMRLASRDRSLDAVPHDPIPGELEALCTALISDDDTAAAEIISGVRADGTPPDVVYLKYLAAAARMLGEWWIEDRADFVQVTIGTGRMFAIMRGMRHLFVSNVPAPGKTAIFASVPGEDHTLGVRMAADIFRKEGWEIALKIGLDHDELVTEVERSPGRIVGLSIGGRHSVDALSRLVVALHICSPGTPLLVSGQNIDAIRPLLSLMGLDGVAGDIDEAKEQMAALSDRQSEG
ncbi:MULTISPECIES: B12-binding domain-containing protein [unclassified Roseovarius]|uniref:cobalamin B12-binding domain-containing protein n=1 Tax=unclassified Roseovarius TaxID=2614913 RepID=UPI00273D4D68|nr:MULTISPECIES: hypothetical protein [unclassified Roseovarius]